MFGDPSTNKESFLSSTGGNRGERSLALLEETNRTAIATEELGANILGQLHGQREQLESTIARREEANDQLALSSALIRRMFQRAFTMKIFLCLIVTLLLGGIGFIVWLKWGPKDDKKHHRLLSEAADDSIGEGLILVIVFGVAWLLACVLATGFNHVKRSLIWLGATAIYGSILALLFLLPREEASDDAQGRTEVTDNFRSFYRTCLFLFSFIFSLVALVKIMRVGCTPVRAVQLIDPEADPAFRVVKG